MICRAIAARFVSNSIIVLQDPTIPTAYHTLAGLGFLPLAVLQGLPPSFKLGRSLRAFGILSEPRIESFLCSHAPNFQPTPSIERRCHPDSVSSRVSPFFATVSCSVGADWVSSTSLPRLRRPIHVHRWLFHGQPSLQSGFLRPLPSRF